MYISTYEDLSALCARARGFSAVAIDTEFLRERTYHAKLCLVQIATPDECAVIDPLAIDDLSPLADLMADVDTLKVFHACSQDMEVLNHALGVCPAPIFDTQVAAGFLGERAQCSYHNLVHSFCGVSLPKTESLTDWSRRPLSPQQIEYAVDDVRYLIDAYRTINLVHSFCGVSLPKTESLTDWSRRPLSPQQIEYAVDDVRYLIDAYRTIESKLHSLGRTAWVRDEIRPLADPAHYRTDPRAAFKRVKRVNACTRRQLAVARELAAWREQRAETRDVPRKWVMSDEVLLALCKRAPKTIEDFRAVRGTEQLSARDVEVALDAIARGRRCPADNLPSVGRAHRTPAPELESVIDLMYALIRLVSERSGVATSLIISRDGDNLPSVGRAHRTPAPELESVIDLMYALIRLVSERSGVATSLIISRDGLLDYIDRPERSPLREGWRFELVGTLIDDLLRGDIGLTVKDGALEIL